MPSMCSVRRDPSHRFAAGFSGWSACVSFGINDRATTATMIRDDDDTERDAYISPQLDEEFRRRKEQANGKNVPLPSEWSEEKIREYRRWCDRLRRPRKRRATTCAKVDTYFRDDSLPLSLQTEFQERHAAVKGRNVAYPQDWGDTKIRQYIRWWDRQRRPRKAIVRPLTTTRTHATISDSDSDFEKPKKRKKRRSNGKTVAIATPVAPVATRPSSDSDFEDTSPPKRRRLLTVDAKAPERGKRRTAIATKRASGKGCDADTKRRMLLDYPHVRPNVSPDREQEFYARFVSVSWCAPLPSNWNDAARDEWKKWQNRIHSAHQRAKGYGKVYNQTRDGRWRTVKASARTRGYTVTITKEEAFALFESPCHYCGRLPDAVLNGIDRSENDGNYTPDNVVACCALCNMMKCDSELDVFLQSVSEIHLYQAIGEPCRAHRSTPRKRASPISRCRDGSSMSTYMARAEKRNLPFELTEEQFQDLVDEPCTYCGVSRSGGVDRVDNDLGYLLDNSTSACARCNYMKKHYTASDFISQVATIYEHTMD